jgi:hypothetical protein
MSIFGAGTSDFAPLSGLESEEYGEFTDLNVSRYLYLKDAADTYEGYNAPLITTNKTNDDMIFNTTTLSSNFLYTVGTGQDTKETVFSINPTDGLGFEANNNPVTLSWNELSYLNNARSNLQTQIDNLDPDISSNQGYWGNFWNGNTITNSGANAVNTVAFPSTDPDTYGVSITSSNRLTVSHAGIYMFIATIQIAKSQGSTEEEVFFWIRKNGVDVPDTGFKESVKSTPKLICANWQVKLQANDYIQLMWSSPDIHMTLIAYGAGTTPTKPAIPSVIMTVSQVSFLVAGGAGLLPLTYNAGTKNVLCDASFQVVGKTDLSGNLVVRQNMDVSGNVTLSGTSVTYLATTIPISVQNSLWTDGSGVTPTNAAKVTTMFSNIKNTTITVQGWTFSGTAITTINGYAADWVYGNPGSFNLYNSPMAGSINGISSGLYWMNFYCYSPGTTQTNSTFYLEAPPTLQPGLYNVEWYSKFTAGTQYSTTSLSVSLGSGTSLLTYNDSDTRATNIWRLRSLKIEVKTAAKLRWTYRDTQATSNRLFSASVTNLQITQYPGIRISDASNNTYLAASIAQINNASLIGSNAITGSLNMTGTPYFYTTNGATNIGISTDFGTATGASANATNIAIGAIAPFAAGFSNCLLMGMNTANDNSFTGKAVASNSVVVASDSGSPNNYDVMVGSRIQKKGSAAESAYNTLVGTLICDNATSSQPLIRCTALGSNMWNTFYNASTPTTNPPQENVAIGYGVQSRNALLGGSYNTAVGCYSQAWLSGNITNASYNTSIGWSSGIDPRAELESAFREKYYGGTYIGTLARSRGDVVGVRNATALGYNASADASYCCVIGADASYNVANSIRLGRPQDTTVASSLIVNGTTTLTGNTQVGNLSITGSVSGLSFSSLNLAGTLTVSGDASLNSNVSFGATGGTTTAKFLSNIVDKGDGWSLYITSGNVRLDSGLKLNVDCGVEGGITYGVYDLVAYIKERDQVCYDRGTEGVIDASNAQATADAALALAGSADAAVVALGIAIDARIDAIDLEIDGIVGDLGDLNDSVGTLQTKTAYMNPVSTTFSRSEFFNRIAVFPYDGALSYGILLDPSGTSSFTGGIDANNINTTAGQVNNLRGATVNIGDTLGAVNIDSSNVSLGNVAASSVRIGSETSNVEVSGSTITVGEGALYSTINLNGAVYINSILYIPFNPASFTTGFTQFRPFG